MHYSKFAFGLDARAIIESDPRPAAKDPSVLNRSFILKFLWGFSVRWNGRKPSDLQAIVSLIYWWFFVLLNVDNVLPGIDAWPPVKKLKAPIFELKSGRAALEGAKASAITRLFSSFRNVLRLGHRDSFAVPLASTCHNNNARRMSKGSRHTLVAQKILANKHLLVFFLGRPRESSAFETIKQLLPRMWRST